MTYPELLAMQPASAGTPATAAEYAQMLTRYLETEDTSALTRAERNYLYRLRQKWTKRAEGRDARWRRGGIAPGRKTEMAGQPAATPTADDDGDLDPLSASLIRKYGRPETA